MPYVGSSHCFINRGDGKKLHIFNATPPSSSYSSASLANDKFGTEQLLKEAGIPQLESLLVNSSVSFETQRDFMKSMGKIVVKPVDGAHGKGVTVNVANEDDLRSAVEGAFMQKKSIDAVILQKQYDHASIYEIRALCINYVFVAAIWRVPARVVGDGQHTVRELIEQENAKPRRGKPYYTPLAMIDLEKAKDYLGTKIDEIPESGKEISVLGVANYGMGGEIIDATDILPDWLKRMAEKTAKTCGLPVIGIDVMLGAMPEPSSSPQELDAVVIEVNKSPSLVIHDRPSSGTPRPATALYFDYLASLDIT